jgi:hypothetical protein
MARKDDLEKRVDGISKLLLATMAYLAKRDDKFVLGVDTWLDFNNLLEEKTKELRRLMEIPSADRTRGQRRQITLLRKELRILKAVKRLWEKNVTE